MTRSLRTALARAAASIAAASMLLLGFGVAPASAAVVTISGIVTVDGVPTAGITVTDGLFPQVTTVTDENGYYEFLDGANGWHWIGVLDPDDLYHDASGFADITDESPTAVVDVQLRSTGPATGTVSGTVTVDGVPTAGITVFTGGLGPDAPHDESDANGHFEITGLNYNSYALNVEDPDDLYASSSAFFSISASEQTVVLDVPLVTWAVGTASVSGVVIDADTDLPIAGATVYFGGNFTVRGQSYTTGDDGVFEFFDIPATLANVTVLADGYASTNVNFPILDGEHVPLEIELKLTNAMIHGSVRDAEGNGIGSVLVRARPMVGASGAYTGPGGAYTLGPIAAGDYELTAGGPGTPWNKVTLDVTAIANESIEVNFVLEPRDSGSIGGYVLGPNEGSYTKVCVNAYDENGDRAGDAGVAGSGEGGTWRIDALAPGDYRLLFWDCDSSRTPAFASTFYGGVGSLAEATPVTVAAGDDVHIGAMNLVLGGTIQGHIDVETPDGVVEFPAGRSVDATVFQLVGDAWEPVPNPLSLAQTGVAGDYTIDGLLPGTYRVGFISSGTGPRDYAAEYFDDVATVGAADDIVIVGGDTVDEINASVAIPKPAAAPLAVATDALDPADKDDIAVNKTVVAQGKTLEVEVGAQYAGEWVSVWGHSTPVLLGSWVQVPSTGVVTVPVPAALLAGTHTIVVQDAAGSVIGWTSGIQVTGVGGATGLAALVATGAGAALWAVPVGGAVLILGLALVLSRRRSAEATSDD